MKIVKSDIDAFWHVINHGSGNYEDAMQKLVDEVLLRKRIAAALLRKQITECDRSLERRFRGMQNGVDIDWAELQEHRDRLAAQLAAMETL